MKKKSRTGILHSNEPQKMAHKHHGNQRYSIIFKNKVIPEQKYMYHSAE